MVIRYFKNTSKSRDRGINKQGKGKKEKKKTVDSGNRRNLKIIDIREIMNSFF